MTKHSWGVFALVMSVCGGQAFAEESLGGGCKQVRATIVDSKATEGCNSPNGFCAAGTVHGNLGLNGTTWFVLDGFVRVSQSAPAYRSPTGILVYTTPHGTLTVRETGISLPETAEAHGRLAALQEVLEGTGRFSGATGFLYLASEAIQGTFYADLTGELCLP